MKIQGAIKMCQKVPESFARPVSWRGTRFAVDLARRMRKDRISRVESIHENAVWGSEWAMSPEDLLEEWEIVTLKTLAQNTQGEKECPEK